MCPHSSVTLITLMRSLLKYGSSVSCHGPFLPVFICSLVGFTVALQPGRELCHHLMLGPCRLLVASLSWVVINRNDIPDSRVQAVSVGQSRERRHLQFFKPY